MTEDDTRLLAALRRGDETAFATLVSGLNPAMLRVAHRYVADRTVAEEVVQEAWLGVLRRLDHFEGRSSLKTWIFKILTNRAKSRWSRERRCVPFSSLLPAGDPAETAVEPERFADSGEWTAPPRSWADLPEERLLSGEARARVDEAISDLPPAQRAVITLRDVQARPAAEVCDLLGLTEGNQRVLLHRARAKVRRRLESYVTEEATALSASR